MTNIFAQQEAIQELNDNTQSIGKPGFYTPGIYTIVSAELFLYKTEWEGTTYENCDIVLTSDTGATLVDSLRTTAKANQTVATTDYNTYLHNMASVTGSVIPHPDGVLEKGTNKVMQINDKIYALSKVNFDAAPNCTYTDRFKKEHKALSVKVFANAKFKAMTYSEVSGSANGIFTSQRVTLNQVFRFLDNASLGEIKDNKEEVGGSFAYWTEDEIKCAAKAQVQYSTKRDERDTAVLEVIVDHLKEAKPFTKEQREKIQDHFDADYAKSVLAGATTSAAVDTSSVDVEEDDSETPSFG